MYLDKTWKKPCYSRWKYNSKNPKLCKIWCEDKYISDESNGEKISQNSWGSVFWVPHIPNIKSVTFDRVVKSQVMTCYSCVRSLLHLWVEKSTYLLGKMILIISGAFFSQECFNTWNESLNNVFHLILLFLLEFLTETYFPEGHEYRLHVCNWSKDLKSPLISCIYWF